MSTSAIRHSLALDQLVGLYDAMGWHAHRQEYHIDMAPGLVRSLKHSTDPNAMGVRKRPDLLVGPPGGPFYEEDLKLTLPLDTSKNCAIELEQMVRLLLWSRHSNYDLRIMWRLAGDNPWRQYRVDASALAAHIVCYGSAASSRQQLDDLMSTLEGLCGPVVHDRFVEPRNGTGKPFVVIHRAYFAPPPWELQPELAL